MLRNQTAIDNRTMSTSWFSDCVIRIYVREISRFGEPILPDVIYIHRERENRV